MPEYTQEQIKDAIETLKKCTEIEGRYKTGPYKCKQPTMGGYVYVSEGIFTISLLKERDIILAALEAAEKERDEKEQAEIKEFWDGALKNAIDLAKSVEAYAAKLEKAGDAFASRLFATYSDPMRRDWDAARKAKP